MATPVPVVSMMYFFVFTPPKTFFMCSPAFSAMSTNCAIGFAAGFGGSRGAQTRARERKKGKARCSRKPAAAGRRSERRPNIVVLYGSIFDIRFQHRLGQGGFDRPMCLPVRW